MISMETLTSSTPSFVELWSSLCSVVSELANEGGWRKLLAWYHICKSSWLEWYGFESNGMEPWGEGRQTVFDTCGRELNLSCSGWFLVEHNQSSLSTLLQCDSIARAQLLMFNQLMSVMISICLKISHIQYHPILSSPPHQVSPCSVLDLFVQRMLRTLCLRISWMVSWVIVESSSVLYSLNFCACTRTYTTSHLSSYLFNK